MSTRRNVVLVTYDSLRADHCGFMGHGRDTTPTMDAMAADGVVFENALASGVPTIASMTAVMTGQHSLASPEIGFNREQRAQLTARPTVAETLSAAGYATGGLSPNPPASSYFGFDQGFDWFEDFLAADAGVLERAWNRVFRRSIEGGSAATYLRLARNVLAREEVLRPWEDYYDRILQWRESVEEPYFLWVLLLEPHHPWVPPRSAQRWSSTADKYRSFRHYWEMLDGDWRPGFDGETRRRLLDLYDDSVRYGDAFLGRLREDLADDDPVFVVHADHGEEFGEEGRYGHQPYLSEALVHVPLVVAGLDDRGPSRVAEPVGLRDLAPTIADIAGVDHPFAGRSILDGRRRRCVTAKVFAGGERRLAIRADGLGYRRQDGRVEVTGTGDASPPDDVAALFETLSAEESHIEAHQEAIREGAETLAEEGRV